VQCAPQVKPGPRATSGREPHAPPLACTFGPHARTSALGYDASVSVCVRELFQLRGLNVICVASSSAAKNVTILREIAHCTLATGDWVCDCFHSTKGLSWPLSRLSTVAFLIWPFVGFGENVIQFYERAEPEAKSHLRQTY